MSVIESVIDAGEELTKYFEAAIANSFSSIQAPVDTMEQQAEHCQVERMQGGEKFKKTKKTKHQKEEKREKRWVSRRYRRGEKALRGRDVGVKKIHRTKVTGR